jgi:sec-independent protein translocase protein TatA
MEFFSPGHLIVIAIVALVLFFGWKQLPDMARSLGRSLRIFKTEIKGMSEDDKARATAKDEADSKPKALPQADVVKRADEVEESAQDAARARPRPSPAPNGQSQTSARSD